MSKLSLAVIVLTFNEEKNIEKCLKSVYGLATEIFIVDSYSNDKTIEIAKKYTDKVYQHPFENQAEQFNWALDNLPVSMDWILRLDADEFITVELIREIQQVLPKLPLEITGLYMKRRMYFMGRWIKYGGYYPTWLLRMWRRGKARSEGQYLNEHIIILEGKTAQLSHDIVDWNQKGLDFWTEKHNHFATRYARELLELQQEGSLKDINSIRSTFFGSQEERKRWLKEKFYVRLPYFLRSFIYFIYRYFVRLGFLDGKEGMIFHVLQAFWYHFLTDAKVYEMHNKKQR